VRVAFIDMEPSSFQGARLFSRGRKNATGWKASHTYEPRNGDISMEDIPFFSDKSTTPTRARLSNADVVVPSPERHGAGNSLSPQRVGAQAPAPTGGRVLAKVSAVVPQPKTPRSLRKEFSSASQRAKEIVQRDAREDAFVGEATKEKLPGEVATPPLDESERFARLNITAKTEEEKSDDSDSRSSKVSESVDQNGDSAELKRTGSAKEAKELEFSQEFADVVRTVEDEVEADADEYRAAKFGAGESQKASRPARESGRAFGQNVMQSYFEEDSVYFLSMDDGTAFDNAMRDAIDTARQNKLKDVATASQQKHRVTAASTVSEVDREVSQPHSKANSGIPLLMKPRAAGARDAPIKRRIRNFIDGSGDGDGVDDAPTSFGPPSSMDSSKLGERNKLYSMISRTRTAGRASSAQDDASAGAAPASNKEQQQQPNVSASPAGISRTSSGRMLFKHHSSRLFSAQSSADNDGGLSNQASARGLLASRKLSKPDTSTAQTNPVSVGGAGAEGVSSRGFFMKRPSKTESIASSLNGGDAAEEGTGVFGARRTRSRFGQKRTTSNSYRRDRNKSQEAPVIGLDLPLSSTAQDRSTFLHSTSAPPRPAFASPPQHKQLQQQKEQQEALSPEESKVGKRRAITSNLFARARNLDRKTTYTTRPANEVEPARATASSNAATTEVIVDKIPLNDCASNTAHSGSGDMDQGRRSFLSSPWSKVRSHSLSASLSRSISRMERHASRGSRSNPASPHHARPNQAGLYKVASHSTRSRGFEDDDRSDNDNDDEDDSSLGSGAERIESVDAGGGGGTSIPREISFTITVEELKFTAYGTERGPMRQFSFLFNALRYELADSLVMVVGLERRIGLRNTDEALWKYMVATFFRWWGAFSDVVLEVFSICDVVLFPWLEQIFEKNEKLSEASRLPQQAALAQQADRIRALEKTDFANVRGTLDAVRAVGVVERLWSHFVKSYLQYARFVEVEVQLMSSYAPEPVTSIERSVRNHIMKEGPSDPAIVLPVLLRWMEGSAAHTIWVQHNISAASKLLYKVWRKNAEKQHFSVVDQFEL